MASSDIVCRPAASECDISEYCTGTSFSCPADAYEPNGSSCANNTMKCASGVCTSRDEQCIARGLRLGVSESCPFQQDTCQVTCEDPSDPGNCLVLSGMFLDGTECGLAGYCEKGVCKGTGASKVSSIHRSLYPVTNALNLTSQYDQCLGRREQANRNSRFPFRQSYYPIYARSRSVFFA